MLLVYYHLTIFLCTYRRMASFLPKKWAVRFITDTARALRIAMEAFMTVRAGLCWRLLGCIYTPNSNNIDVNLSHEHVLLMLNYLVTLSL